MRKSPSHLTWAKRTKKVSFEYPNDPQIVPYPLATLKKSHALRSWTYADLFKTEQ